jgi:hypothetical protein
VEVELRQILSRRGVGAVEEQDKSPIEEVAIVAELTQLRATRRYGSSGQVFDGAAR